MQVRNPNFNIKSFDKYYAKNSPLLTHFINSLHVIFPEGEQFFIRTIKKFIHRINNQELKEKIKIFIAQETQHKHQHKKLWKILQDQNIDIQSFNEWYSKTAYQGIENFIYKTFGIDYGERISLATTAALEHYTATLANFVLKNEKDIFKNFDSQMQDLLKWHCIEEIEHKDVALEVMKEINENLFIKYIGMLIATTVLIFYASVGTFKFFKEDPNAKIKFTDFIGTIKSTPKAILFIFDIFKYFKI